MRFRRTMVVVLIALTAVGTSGTAALAAEGETDLAGRGWLACKGRGTAELDMGGTLWLQINGSVAIKDLAGDAHVRVNDRADDTRSASTEIVLDDFEGGIKVTGSRFTVAAKGTMRFLAVGHGFAHLDGSGACKHGRFRPWFRWVSRVEV